MNRKTKIPLAIAGVLLLVLAPPAAWKVYRNRVLSNRFERVSQCRQYSQCVAALGPAMYDLKSDDPSELLQLNNLFRGQKSWSARKDVNVALWPGGGVPAKLIYVVYDRRDRRILETGLLQV